MLMRHAKSAWHTDDPDHDRPLNERGCAAAAFMGRWLADHDQLPELILTSTALRARDTAERVVAAGARAIPIRAVRSIYQATAAELVTVLGQAPGSVNRLMLVGHEPGLPDLTALLCGANARFPTAAVARIDLEIDEWPAAGRGCGRLIWLLTPRLLQPALSG